MDPDAPCIQAPDARDVRVPPEMTPPLLHSETHGRFSSSQNTSWGEGSGIYLPCDSAGILSLCQMLLFPQKPQRPGFPCVRERLWTERGCVVQQSLCS